MGRLGLLASAISHRPLQVKPADAGEPTWTDGTVVYLDVRANARQQIESLAVQASLLAAGSLERDVVDGLVRRPTVARRYLAVEGHRALAALDALLPSSVRSLIRPDVAAGSDSPAASLSAAQSRREIVDPPASFGTISVQRLLASLRRAERSRAQPQVARAQRTRALAQLAHDATANATEGPFASQVSAGGGVLGRWLAKLLSPVRQLRDGGSPGAGATAYWTRTGRRPGGRAMFSTATAERANESPAGHRDEGTTYPEWDVHARRYRHDWCTVREVEIERKEAAVRFRVADRTGLRRSLARLGLGIDRYHRQPQGDDIDIDAVIEARVDMLAGSAPDEVVFIDSVRRRRDLSVLLLLDVSGSAAEPAANGRTVHEQQRAAAAALMLALHELGDRVALYAYHSQGRSAVSLMPIKRFGEDAGALAMERLGSLEPGAYSRLGTAIRHGTAVLQDRGGTPRQLLVVLSDGLAYDHGYEPVYGAADARRALDEARRDGVGCVCLSVGASTDADTLRRVFGNAAHATLPEPEQLSHVMAPLFRAAIRSAEVRRRAS